jgi:hypothetical protein
MIWETTMDKAFLEQQLLDLFSHYHAAGVRYRHTAFSSKDLVLLDALIDALKTVLADYTVWHGFNPSLNNAPPSFCSRRDFIQQVFTSDLTGLVICYPEYWLRHWSLLDKQAFWSALSSRHGGHNVLVVFAENAEFAQLNQHYFTAQPLASTAINFWFSSRTSLSQ